MSDDRPDPDSSQPEYGEPSPAPAPRRSAGMGRSPFTDSFGRALPPLGERRKRNRD